MLCRYGVRVQGPTTTASQLQQQRGGTRAQAQHGEGFMNSILLLLHLNLTIALLLMFVPPKTQTKYLERSQVRHRPRAIRTS